MSKHTSKTLADKLRTAGILPYSEQSSYPERNAQANLTGRTHYVDDDTLKFFRSKILKANHYHDDLIFGIVESYADCAGTRKFRPVFFDIFGGTIDRIYDIESFSSRKVAEKEYFRIVDSIDAVTYTLDMIREKICRDENTLKELKKVVGRKGN